MFLIYASKAKRRKYLDAFFALFTEEEMKVLTHDEEEGFNVKEALYALVNDHYHQPKYRSVDKALWRLKIKVRVMRKKGCFKAPGKFDRWVFTKCVYETLFPN